MSSEGGEDPAHSAPHLPSVDSPPAEPPSEAQDADTAQAVKQFLANPYKLTIFLTGKPLPSYLVV